MQQALVQLALLFQLPARQGQVVGRRSGVESSHGVSDRGGASLG
ncbi:MAG: hypothetical protein U1E77_15690 [Inhella sp.]